MGFQSTPAVRPNNRLFHSLGIVSRSGDRSVDNARGPTKSRAGVRYQSESSEQARSSDGSTDVNCPPITLSLWRERETTMDLHGDVHSPALVAQRHNGAGQGIAKIA